MAAKTSQTHPLIINQVPVPDAGGVIGLTFCPGKKGDSMYSGRWDRDLTVDLAAIRDFGAKALVTLMESQEFDGLQVSLTELADRAKEFGLEWHHLPIRDVSIPGERFENQWTYSGLRLRTMLARGENIVVHCHGGLGRTGMIGARLLVEFGDQPDVAIRRVREARPGSIETSAQEKYVKSCSPVAWARVMRSQEERAVACLIGGAVGDAFGYEVEFSSLKKIGERFGPAGIKAPVFHHGKLIVSDDTQMTLFTLEGVLQSLKKGSSWRSACIFSIQQAYLDWLHTQRGDAGAGASVPSDRLIHQPEMCVQRAPGNTCLGALGSGGHGTIEKPVNDSKGCGGAMRTAPIGLLTFTQVDDVFRIGSEAAALTHGHPSGYLSAGMVAALVRVLMDGTSLTTRPGTYSDSGAIDQCCSILQTYPKHEETLAAVQKAVQLAAQKAHSHASAVESLGGGWVGEEALAIALYAVLSAESYVEAISIAANHGGDSDSTASIAGQLWGAANGLAGMPHDWVSRIDVLLPLLHLARQLAALQHTAQAAAHL